MYIITMFIVVMIGIALMVIGQQWSVVMKREREAELWFRGNRVKEAIERYVADYDVMKSVRPHRYPQTLQELTTLPKRYLPVVYQDPITGDDFELIKSGTDIRGVRSRSLDVPFDQVRFKHAKTYHDIRFEAMPMNTNCQPNPNNPLLPCQPNVPTPSQADKKADISQMSSP
ncbi:MAG: hypothetical protein D6690_12245 [Nitrospirae bacterium]|nr:MAG: hypothetical protein D6690_12245 [Nitrospirota bacterium]